MERKFISIDALKKVLSPKEMKNVTGGSYATCKICCDYGDGEECHDGSCASSDPAECFGYGVSGPDCWIDSCW